MSLTIDFVGMVYFVHEDNDRRVLLPDGTKQVDDVPLHFASFFIDRCDVRDADWWPTEKHPALDSQKVLEYRIPNAKTRITISGVSTALRDAALKTARHEPLLPKLRSFNPNFTLDTKHPEAIVDMRIRQGTLQACKFGGAVVSQLRSDSSGVVRIEAKSGTETKFIELYDNSEPVLSNTSDIFAPKSKTPVPEDDHFRLYAKLDVKRDFEGLAQPPQISVAGLEALDFNCRYLALVQQELGFEIPRESCSNTCC